jgi:recombination protein RecA
MADIDEIDKLIASANEHVGEKVATRLEGGAVPMSEVVEVIPTSLDVMDKHIIAAGGLPGGRMVELYSKEGVAKSSLLYRFIASAQRNGAIGALIETESRLNKDRMTFYGVDTESLILSETKTVEQMLRTAEGLIHGPKKSPVLLGIDSLAAAPCEKELEEGLIGTEAARHRAKVLTRAVRVMAKAVVENRVTLVITNHEKQKQGIAFGDTVTTPGGDALKFYATLRLWLVGGKAIKKDTQHLGKDITVMCSKSFASEPWRKAKLRLVYATGWDNMWTTIDHAKTMGQIEKGARSTQKNYEKVYKLMEKNGWSTRKAA